MRKTELFYTSILLPLDYFVLILSGLLVYYLRFETLVELRPVIYQLPFLKYLILILINAFIWLGIFALVGLYTLKEKRRLSQEIAHIFIGCSAGTMIIVLFIFFSQQLFSSRFLVLANWLVAIVFLSLAHFFINLVKVNSYKKGRGLETVIVFGQGGETEKIISILKNKKEFGYEVLGHYLKADELVKDWQSRAREISQIIQTDPGLGKEENLKLIEFCNEHQIIFRYITDLFGAISSNVRTEYLADMPVIEIQRTALQGWGRVYKRVFDFVFASLSFLLLLPLFSYLSLVIRLDSEGPVFVPLKRIGERGKIFKLLKFRSMVKEAGKMKKELFQYNERQDGVLFKIANDPRITRFGRFLRKWSLDELPQLINIIKGEMSLVGPRPHEPEEVSKYEKHHKQLLTIKPGLTGLAQISGRSGLSFEQEARLDIYYIENWSLGFDFEILIKTIRVVLSKKGAV